MRDWGLSWGGWLDNRRGEWWLLGQLVLIALDIALPWPWLEDSAGVVAGGLVLIGVWGSRRWPLCTGQQPHATARAKAQC